MQTVNIITQCYPSFFKTPGITLQITVISLPCVTVLGVIFGLLRVSDLKALKLIIDVYINIIRGTPLSVQVMIMMYDAGSASKPYGFQWNNIGGVFTTGYVALSLNVGAYMAGIIREGTEVVDEGQMEAAKSLGLSYDKAMRRMILLQAFGAMLPSVINQFIISLKDTSFVPVVGPRELTQNGKIVAANSASMVMPTWIYVALSYLIVCTTLSRTVGYMEGRMPYGK